MDRETVLEYLRLVLIAFVIAFIINLIRVAIVGWNNEVPFVNITEPETAPFEQTQHSQTEQLNTSNSNRSTNNPELARDFNPDELDEKGRIQIPLTPRLNLSGKSKSEILELRIQAVKSSTVFNRMNYNPSPSVFNITDNLPWISASGALYWSKATENERISGPSRDSIGILNPELLYYVSLAEYDDTDKNDIPLYKPYFFVPYKVLYRPEKKRIIAYYECKRNENGTYEHISLADANAHDLGYNYAYMDMHENIGFYSSSHYRDNTLASGIKEVTGYYTHGSACGISGGCNNYAPYWQYYNDFYVKDLPAKFNIKLWKQKPANPEDEADINFKMYFY